MGSLWFLKDCREKVREKRESKLCPALTSLKHFCHKEEVHVPQQTDISATLSRVAGRRDNEMTCDRESTGLPQTLQETTSLSQQGVKGLSKVLLHLHVSRPTAASPKQSPRFHFYKPRTLITPSIATPACASAQSKWGCPRGRQDHRLGGRPSSPNGST